MCVCERYLGGLLHAGTSVQPINNPGITPPIRRPAAMEQVSDEEVEHAGEEADSDEEDQDLDQMFGAWLGELEKLTKSLDDGRPDRPGQQKAPLRQESNMANLSYRFSVYNINEALNQREGVDLDSLMADLCSIEQELTTDSSKTSRLGLTDTKVRQKPPAGRSARADPAGDGGGSGGSSARVSPAGTVRGPNPTHWRPPLASNFSLEDITAQLEKASLSMDEAARQSSSHSSTSWSAPMRGQATSQHHHRRTGSVGTVSEHEARLVAHSSRSSVASASGASVNSASSMDSLDRVLRFAPSDANHSLATPPPEGTNQGPASTEHSYLDSETSLILKNMAGKPSHLLTKEEQAAKTKADNIRVALEKIKEAQVKKLVIRVHLSDESSKTMMVDERQTVRQVLDNLLDKSHCGFSPDWSLVETIHELQMERVFEDHENLVENLLNWTRDGQNRLMFTERMEKYAVFKNPQNYLLGRKETCEMADRNKEALLEECFGGGSVSVPEMEGVLWLKEDGKKSWKKRYFLLRASGIYYVPKGKAKASRDLVCFLQLHHVNIYYGQDYRSKYKAPSDYCLVLKHPQIQKKSQYIKYLCCDDVRTLQQWVNSIRIAKYGKQLYLNFQEVTRRSDAAYDWSSLSSSSIQSGSSNSSMPESQSNHSSQSDSGVSEMTSSCHACSQSVVSSIFSDAWRRGEMLRIDPISRPIPVQIPSMPQYPPSQPPPSRNSYTGNTSPSEECPPSPPLPGSSPMAAPGMQLKYSTLAHPLPRAQSAGPLPPMAPALPDRPGYNTLPAAYCTPPPSQTLPAPVFSALTLGLAPPPPPPEEEEELLPPPPSPPSPPSPPHSSLCNAGLQEFLSHKFPHMEYDFSSHQEDSPPPPPPPPQLSPPASLQFLPPAPPKSFSGGFPPQTARKPSGPSSLPLAISPLSPLSPTPPSHSHGPMRKQQSFSAGHSPSQPPPTLPKQHSLSSRQLPLSTPASSPSSSSSLSLVAAATSSLVKQIVNQFPGNSPPSSSCSAPLSPPAVKTKPRWGRGGSVALHSPEFPPPPSESDFPPPPLGVGGCSSKPRPPALQRASIMRVDSQEERPKKVDSLVSLFAKTPPPSSSGAGSPSKDSSSTPPKPGKLNLATLPLVLQGLQTGQHRQPSPPSPPPQHLHSSPDYFPPPPSDSELFPPPPLLRAEFASPLSRVAVVNPQPQQPSSSSPASSWKQGSSLKKGAGAAPSRRSSGTPLSPPPLSQTPPPSLSSYCPSPVPPTSPKAAAPPGLALQPHFLEDLNRTLKRKSVSRHGVLAAAGLLPAPSKTEPMGTVDDLALLPPPPPELLQSQKRAGHSQTLSRHHTRSQSAKHAHISGYATLRRGPPPAPPKRDQNTKLTGEW
ncbi:ras-associated and pleckstrin homology domains-containing protein 1a [Gadus chalcogrammus]|uniref:ras-associated and pleckstrin homology domains-containing protein 1a n=1 Tax=Gadus chalcogrammus TaxID=1042646 RepID=UPI0024C4AF78|nr:ras-associated and pleckstrin homology domains-containing protein 1a [Gadus chalcogrammus]